MYAEVGTEVGMKSKNTLTGDRKIMNMQKLGTVVQSKMLSTVAPKTLITRMNRASRAIHYAYFKGAASRHGSRHGFAFDVTNLLRALPSGCNFSAPEKIIYSSALVTHSRSLPNWHNVFSHPTPRNPLRVETSSGLKSAKQLFQLFSINPMGLRPVFYPSNPINNPVASHGVVYLDCPIII
jgi:hypothetical protein